MNGAMRLMDRALRPASVHGIAGLRTRLLRQFSIATTGLYAAGVVATVLPHGDRVTADVSGGAVAVALGVVAVVALWVRPESALAYRTALDATMLATPAVMAFHVLSTAQVLCLVAVMFLAMHIRAFSRDRDARISIAVLVALALLALYLSPAPTYPITYLIYAVAIVGAAEMFGAVTKALIAASCTDPLTGVLNRAGWEIATAEAVAGVAGRRNDASTALTVVIIDVDDFKSVNDTAGHRAGDELLIELAKSWSLSAPGGSVIARIGGDEFAALLAGHSKEVADGFVRKTIESVPYASVGSAASQNAAEPISDILARADTALYEAKNARMEKGRRGTTT